MFHWGSGKGGGNDQSGRGDLRGGIRKDGVFPEHIHLLWVYLQRKPTLVIDVAQRRREKSNWGKREGKVKEPKVVKLCVECPDTPGKIKNGVMGPRWVREPGR